MRNEIGSHFTRFFKKNSTGHDRFRGETSPSICKMNDPVALDSWAEHALDCQSMAEFATAIR
ncbi:MAG: hypothetical protein FWC43_03745 [Planctomycetaceae bacterium]|nr:hypothetical protein [Planctomycetaceae bacterium]